MRYLLVDRIDRLSGSTAHGERNFVADDPFRYEAADGRWLISNGALIEAIGQLASWQCLERTQFRTRPIVVHARGLRVLGAVSPGTRVALSARLDSLDENDMSFSGEAVVDGRVVQTIESCRCVLMPLALLEDPDESRRRLERLREGGLRSVDGGGGPAYPYDAMIDDVVELEVGKMVTVVKTWRATEPFFRDHFPRMPVTPGVMLSELVTSAAQRLVGERAGSIRECLRWIRDLKLRRFVRPGDRCTLRLTAESTPVDQVTTMFGEIEVDGQVIMRGRYGYELRA